MINLFGLIATNPIKLSKHKDPIGKNNDLVTLKVLEFWKKNLNCDLWLGWGDKGKLYRRDLIILKLIKNLSDLESSEKNESRRILSLGINKNGSPRHPLYVPNESFLKPFKLNFK